MNIRLSEKEIYDYTISKMNEFELIDKQWNFEFSEVNVTNYVGLCDFNFPNNKKIYFNNKIINWIYQSELEELTLHEIAHAIDFEQRYKSNHDKVWKNLFKSIGGTGTTHLTFMPTYTPITPPDENKRNPYYLWKYIGFCCGTAYPVDRIRKNNPPHCTHCSKKIKLKYNSE